LKAVEQRLQLPFEFGVREFVAAARVVAHEGGGGGGGPGGGGGIDSSVRGGST
jgi:hypothetical protein